MKKNIVIVGLVSLFPTLCFAQSVVDAGRVASSSISGTSRYLAMGGAFGAVGGDPTCMNDNPAGIGIYRGHSELSFTPSFQNVNAPGAKAKANFSVANLSYIFSLKPEAGNLVNVNIGFGINRNEGYKRRYANYSPFYQYSPANAGFSLASYITDTYIDDDKSILGQMANPKDMGIVIPENKMIYSVDDYYGWGRQLSNEVEETTRNDSYNFNISANWDDSFYAGVTFNVIDFNSIINSYLLEEYGSGQKLNDYSTYFETKSEIKGSGFGIKLGAIYRVSDLWRIGAAIHTPTWYSIKDYQYAYLEHGTYDNFDYSETETLDYVYSFHTPWQFQFSSAWVLGTRGLLSVEYDLQNADYSYSGNGYSKNDDFSYANELLNVIMKKEHTFKAGLELRLNKQLSARLGYAYKTAPFDFTKNTFDEIDNVYLGWSDDSYYGNGWGEAVKADYSYMQDQHFISGGLGYKAGNWVFDLAVQDRIMNQMQANYVYEMERKLLTNIVSVNLTLGYRF